MVPLLAVQGARDATTNFVEVHSLGKMLAEGEEVRHGIHDQSKDCNG
jgi:hypothetical protein